MTEAMTSRLKALFLDPEPFEFACPPTVNHALMLQEIGHPAVYIAAGSVIGGITGRPDNGTITLTESVTIAGYYANALDIPVWVDADVCFGGIFTVERAVQDFLRAGVAGITIEDQPLESKRFGGMVGKQVIPIEEAVAKFRIAADTRAAIDPDFVIVARCDALAAVNSSGLDEAIDRLRAYKEAGADVLYIEAPRSVDELRAVREAVSGPLICTMFALPRNLTHEENRELGIAAYCYTSAIPLAVQMYGALYREIAERGPQVIEEYFARYGTGDRRRVATLERLRAMEERYLPRGTTTGGSVFASEHTARHFGVSD